MKINDNLEIEEIIGTISGDEKGWTKSLLRCKWYNGEPVFDIRKINVNAKKVGSGITLNDEEATSLARMLVEKDFVTVDELEQNVVRMKKRFDVEPSSFKFKEPVTLDFT